MSKIALVLLMALSLSGCAGLGLIGPIAQSLANTMDGGNQQVVYSRPASYTCSANGPWVNCDPN